MKGSHKAGNPTSTEGNPAGPAAPTIEAIATRAYSIWEQEARPEGREVEHGLPAEIPLLQPRHQGRLARRTGATATS